MSVISIDIDKTYTTDPAFFHELIVHLQRWGHKVGALTIREAHDVPFEPWDFVLSPTDEELAECPHSEEGVVREWKTKAIIDNGIDIHFDDLADCLGPEILGLAKGVKVYDP